MPASSSTPGWFYPVYLLLLGPWLLTMYGLYLMAKANADENQTSAVPLTVTILAGVWFAWGVVLMLYYWKVLYDAFVNLWSAGGACCPVMASYLLPTLVVMLLYGGLVAVCWTWYSDIDDTDSLWPKVSEGFAYGFPPLLMVAVIVQTAYDCGSQRNKADDDSVF